jgi:hypothetical protein
VEVKSYVAHYFLRLPLLPFTLMQSSRHSVANLLISLLSLETTRRFGYIYRADVTTAHYFNR